MKHEIEMYCYVEFARSKEFVKIPEGWRVITRREREIFKVPKIAQFWHIYDREWEPVRDVHLTGSAPTKSPVIIPVDFDFQHPSENEEEKLLEGGLPE